MAQELTKDTFKDETAAGVVVVDFWAEWCGPCKRLIPIFEELSGEMEAVKFFKINVDTEQELATEYGVMSIPTLIFMKDGKEVDRSVGALNKDVLKKKIEELG